MDDLDAGGWPKQDWERRLFNLYNECRASWRRGWWWQRRCRRSAPAAGVCRTCVSGCRPCRTMRCARSMKRSSARPCSCVLRSAASNCRRKRCSTCSAALRATCGSLHRAAGPAGPGVAGGTAPPDAAVHPRGAGARQRLEACSAMRATRLPERARQCGFIFRQSALLRNRRHHMRGAIGRATAARLVDARFR